MPLVLQVPKDRLARRARPARPARQVQPGRPVQQAHRVRLVQPVHRARRVHRELQAQQALPVPLELRVRRAQLVRKVRPDQTVPLVT